MSSVWTERFAPAKVNLYLHVGAVAPDGYHPVSSLMVFADVGDSVRLRDGHAMAFAIEGAFAGTLKADPDNLVTRARDRLLAGVGGPVAPFELVLDKGLPIAAGLGGGSADAAAALVLIAGRLAVRGEAVVPAERLADIARGLGTDVNACIEALPVIGLGRGDDLVAAPALPVLHAVLVNPLAPSPTGAVYRAYDRAPAAAGADTPTLPTSFPDAASVVAFLRATRNDLEAPAVALQPLIGEVLAALTDAPETGFTRMSGSGATCFALVANAEESRLLARRISADHPGWWVRACRLAVPRGSE